MILAYLGIVEEVVRAIAVIGDVGEEERITQRRRER
jgi:hypothetical protein